MNKLEKMNEINDGGEFLKKLLEQQEAPIDVEVLSPSNKFIDALLKINENIVLIEFKPQIYPQNVLGVIEQLKKHSSGEYLMAIANYISPEAKKILKEKGINYLDKAENISLNLPNLVLQMEGKKNESLMDNYRFRAFTKTGGAVVFQFLMNPELVNSSQRKIAEYSGVSLGTIPRVFEGLKRDGFIVNIDKKKMKLVEYEKLLLKWVEVLRDKILPANYIQKYSPATITANDLLIDGYVNGETQWGGEPAAALITAYLRPEKYSMFTSDKSILMRKYKLVPTSNGEISVYSKFWNYSEYDRDHVHPILVYGQLMASGDSRNIETAEIIFNEHIKPNI